MFRKYFSTKTFPKSFTRMSHQKLQWGSHPRQHVQLFKYDSTKKDTVVFIHGGGWVQESETAVDYLPMVEGLKFDANMFGVEYRLSPEVKDPFHLLDVLHGLDHIFRNYKVSRLHLVGHSVGAFLCLQIQDHTKVVESGLKELVKADVITKTQQEEELEFLKKLEPYWKKVQLVIVIYLSGVYDIFSGLQAAKSNGVSEDEIRGYSYVLDAFVTPEHYTNATQVSNKVLIHHFRKFKLLGSMLFFIRSLMSMLKKFSQFYL